VPRLEEGDTIHRLGSRGSMYRRIERTLREMRESLETSSTLGSAGSLATTTGA
jgi:hypothetical protein